MKDPTFTDILFEQGKKIFQEIRSDSTAEGGNKIRGEIICPLCSGNRGYSFAGIGGHLKTTCDGKCGVSITQ